MIDSRDQPVEQIKECNCKDRLHLEGAILCPNCQPEQPKDNHSSTCASINHPYADCTCPEQPNQNLMIITEIEGLISQANEKMYNLPIHPVRSRAIEEIDILLRITIKKQLREAFE